MEQVKTLQQAIIHFASFENCKAFMVALRWPNGNVKCPQCGADKVTWLEKARAPYVALAEVYHDGGKAAC